jgi:hypothetical protein
MGIVTVVCNNKSMSSFISVNNIGGINTGTSAFIRLCIVIGSIITFVVLHALDSNSQDIYTNTNSTLCSVIQLTNLHAFHVVLCLVLVVTSLLSTTYGGLLVISLGSQLYMHLVEVLWL